jgi:hypothetical protein
VIHPTVAAIMNAMNILLYPLLIAPFMRIHYCLLSARDTGDSLNVATFNDTTAIIEQQPNDDTADEVSHGLHQTSAPSISPSEYEQWNDDAGGSDYPEPAGAVVSQMVRTETQFEESGPGDLWGYSLESMQEHVRIGSQNRAWRRCGQLHCGQLQTAVMGRWMPESNAAGSLGPTARRTVQRGVFIWRHGCGDAGLETK